MRRAGVDGCKDQHGLTGERDACTLDGYEEQNGPIAISSKEIPKVIYDALEHIKEYSQIRKYCSAGCIPIIAYTRSVLKVNQMPLAGQ